MLDWFKAHWRTSAVGLAYIGCNVGALFVPFLASICPWIDKALIAGGFVAAADAAVINQLNQALTDAAKNLSLKPATVKAGLLLCLLLLAAPASAQTAVSVDIQKASLTWTWQQAGGSAVSEFHVKCGGVSGQYSKITTIADSTAQSAPVSSVIGSNGEWFCVVSAANAFGESSNSNEVHFFAGSKPSGTLSLQLVGN